MTVKDEAAESLRSALRSFMERRGLKAATWCKSAGIPEGTLRNFLTGRSNTLTHATLFALAMAQAVTVSELLGGGDPVDVMARAFATHRDAGGISEGSSLITPLVLREWQPLAESAQKALVEAGYSIVRAKA